MTNPGDMAEGPFKLSVLGDWRSGRSSLVAVLSGKPCPNHPGIQVTRWRATGSGVEVDIWDANSRSTLETLGQTFLSGAHALVAVADATRGDSIEAARHALAAAFEVLGPRPAALLLNKTDLLTDLPEVAIDLPGVSVSAVSARTGQGVVDAFDRLAGRLPPG